MVSGTRSNAAAITLALVAVLPLRPAHKAEAAVSRIEAACASKLARGAFRLARLQLERTKRCKNRLIAGKAAGPCPTSESEKKLARATARFAELAARRCVSTCSVSALPCIADSGCPPLGNGGERCSAGVSDRPFDIGNLNFPGPYCESAIGRPVAEPGDLAECAAAVTREAADAFLQALYGAASAGVSRGAKRCQAAAGKVIPKLALRAFRGLSRCRDAINRGSQTSNPKTCRSDDSNLARALSEVEAKARSVISDQCDDSQIAELDLCGGSAASVSEAQICLVEMANEVADSTLPPALRRFSNRSFIDAAYPPEPVCGDGLVNQLPGAFLLLGEECDGADDAACPGACRPPGDLFECTCGDRRRVRFQASVSGSETDAGWTGLSHNQEVADLSGYVADFDACDCDIFSDATCTGTSNDPVCEVSGRQLPRCSWNLTGQASCDALGNNNGLDEDRDCAVCDQFATNPGALCQDDGDCGSLCYDHSGTPQDPCVQQNDCGAGQTCRGRCDSSQVCVVIPNGGPIAVNAAGSAVCAVQTFRTDITGTRDIVTGAHELFYRIFSRIHLAERTTRPCPVCGGFCVGGSKDLEVCEGRCEASGDRCRFDVDCPAGDRCSDASDDCPGGFCQLSLVCGADPAINAEVVGKPCRIEYEHEFFGTLSSDCRPTTALNIVGRGLEIDYLPATSGVSSLPSTQACTAPGFELYDCPCSDDGGQPTAPNTCAPACDAVGPSFGVGCADGAGGSNGTTCDAGVNVGIACDQDDDCPGGLCNANPTHCEGDVAFERHPCTTNADCGTGLCVDACPGGRCIPLCLPSTEDVAEGFCAAGPPVYHCAGERFAFKTCAQSSTVATCAATCSGSGSPCTGPSKCPEGQTCTGPCESSRECEAGPDGELGTDDDIEGAGACIGGPRSCFVEPLTVEGGSTVNGAGDPTNFFTTTAFCAPASINTGANAGSGFGGPVRIRVHGRNLPNF